jgi:2-polyprenyl-3-methyl-5-hydroxy-6-metoxy-1,4-benzoquinol methylase
MAAMKVSEHPDPGLLWGDACTAAIRSARPDQLQNCKEVARHVLHMAGLTRLVHRRRAARGFHTERYLRDNAAETFRANYQIGGWVHSEGQESRSGIGSSAAVTTGLIERIGAIMKHLGAQSLVDVGCGDWNWMKRGRLDFAYTGIDVVPEVIEENQQHARPGVRFTVCNAIEGPIPTADVALCREVLFHLSFADARAVVKNIKAAAHFLLATTDLDIWFNSDIQTGDFRRINLLRRPFRFPTPLGLVPDRGLIRARYLAVWETASLPG